MEKEPLLFGQLLAAFLLAAANYVVLQVLELEGDDASGALLVANTGIALMVWLISRTTVDSPETVKHKVLDGIELGQKSAPGPLELTDDQLLDLAELVAEKKA